MGSETARRQDGKTARPPVGATPASPTIPLPPSASRLPPPASRRPRVRVMRLIALAVGMAVILAGCAASPEAARVPGEPGADPGNHGNPVVLLAPPNRPDRIYAGIPYDGPMVAAPDTSQS
jgi:hypothetical protein